MIFQLSFCSSDISTRIFYKDQPRQSCLNKQESRIRFTPCMMDGSLLSRMKPKGLGIVSGTDALASTVGFDRLGEELGRDVESDVSGQTQAHAPMAVPPRPGLAGVSRRQATGHYPYQAYRARRRKTENGRQKTEDRCNYFRFSIFDWRLQIANQDSKIGNPQGSLEGFAGDRLCVR